MEEEGKKTDNLSKKLSEMFIHLEKEKAFL